MVEKKIIDNFKSRLFPIKELEKIPTRQPTTMPATEPEPATETEVATEPATQPEVATEPKKEQKQN